MQAGLMLPGSGRGDSRGRRRKRKGEGNAARGRQNLQGSNREIPVFEINILRIKKRHFWENACSSCNYLLGLLLATTNCNVD